MPLGNHRSICAPDAKIIVSKDVGNREHRGLNPNQRHVTHYKIDGEIITTGPRCDFDFDDILLIDRKYFRAVKSDKSNKVTTIIVYELIAPNH